MVDARRQKRCKLWNVSVVGLGVQLAHYRRGNETTRKGRRGRGLPEEK